MTDFLDKVFPFHFVINSELVIQRCGPSLRLLYPELERPVCFIDCFRVIRPAGFPSASQPGSPFNNGIRQLRDAVESLVIIEARRSRLKFRGQVVLPQDAAELLFLCSPWITDLAELEKHGLTMSDFAIHDSFSEFLLLQQAQKSSVADLTKLTEKLTAQRGKLRAANRELQEARELLQRKAEEESRRSAERYQDLFENASDVIYTVARDGAILSLNRAAEQVFGVPREQATGMNLFALVHPDSREQAEELLAPLSGGRAGPCCEIEFCGRSGSIVRLEINSRPVEENGRVVGIQAIARDVTERRLVEKREADRREALEMIASAQPIEAILKQLAVLVQRQSRRCAVSVSLWEHGRFVTVVPFPPEAGENSSKPAKARCTCSRPIPSSSGQVLGRFEIAGPEGECSGAADQDSVEAAISLAGVALEQRMLTEQLYHLSQHDSLTLLPNRARFEERLNQGIMSVRADSRELALLYIDLDRFKQVNDSMGHAAGDAVLREAAARLRNCIGPADTLARIGGDEFTVLIAENVTAEAAEQTADALERALNQPFHVFGRDLFIGASIGISLFPHDAQDALALQTRADVAMYQAKKKGRKRWVRYRAEMDADASRCFEMEAQLNRALERNELSLVYQPQFGLNPVRLVGFEALLRWNNPVLGNVPPCEFIPVAEETGLILAIGNQVLEQACAQAVAWLAGGYDLRKMAVNVSALQFTQSDFPAQIERVLRESGLPASRLELELTESVLMCDTSQTAKQMQSIRALGVAISIDDFGTGQSSLSYLRSLPVDTLKIDRSFLQGPAGEGISPLVEAIIGLGRNLGMKVVAEGIENQMQLSELNLAGCDLVQGFLLGRPMGKSQAEELLGQLSTDCLHALSQAVDKPVIGDAGEKVLKKEVLFGTVQVR
jgi:diguanylate cyclase (GGDEF)-like protein/PAS domain S-box-containing protein